MRKNEVINTVLIIILTSALAWPISAASQNLIKSEDMRQLNIDHPPKTDSGQSNNEVIVQFISVNNKQFSVQNNGDNLQKLCSAYQLQILDENRQNNYAELSRSENSIEPGNLVLLRTSGNVDTLLTALNNAVTKSLYGISYAEPHYYAKPAVVYNDPLCNEQKATQESIYVPEGRDVSAETGVIIVDLDTGADVHHEDIRDGIAPGAWDFVNNSPDVREQYVHGTYTLGISATSNNGIGISGIAGKIPILPLKISLPDGMISIFAAIKAIDYVIGRQPYGTAVFNASWAGPGHSQALDEAINRAGAAGMLFVAAAGNDFNNNDLIPYFPANSSSIYKISVGAFNNELQESASFSNYGTSVDITAPGVNVLTTKPANNYGTVSGTSIATPQVAAAAALIMGRHNSKAGRNYNGLEAKQIIMQSVTEIPELVGKVGSGLLNLRNAMALTRPATEADAGGPFVTTKGEAIQFNCSAEYEEYNWDFGDGETSVLRDPLHNFNKIGRYVVTLKASSGNSESLSSTAVTITDTVAILKAISKKNGKKFTVTASGSKIDNENPMESLTFILLDDETKQIILIQSRANDLIDDVFTFTDKDASRYFPASAKAKVISKFGGKSEIVFKKKN